MGGWMSKRSFPFLLCPALPEDSHELAKYLKRVDLTAAPRAAPPRAWCRPSKSAVPAAPAWCEKERCERENRWRQ